MALQDSDYRFSITILIDEEPVLYCLRGLSMYAQGEGNVYKPWKNAGREEWEHHHHVVTFHFSSPEYRRLFKANATELLSGRWQMVGDSDDNPLPPDDS
jgi:hypothetical protein